MTAWLLLSLLALTLAAPRATLSPGTRLRTLLAGAVVGALGVPLVRLLTPSPPFQLALSLIVLSLPLLAVLSPRHRLRFSVADGFLLGALAGLGYDAYCLALAPRLEYAPLPLVQGRPWPGLAYGCGLMGLAFVAGRRFTLNPSGAWVWWLVALAVTVGDRLQLVPHSPLIFPAFSLLFALAVGEREQQWLRKSPVYPQLRDLPDLRVPPWSQGVLGRLRASRRRRQVMLERAELVRLGNLSFFALPRVVDWVTPPDLPALVLGGLAWLFLLFFPVSYGGSALAWLMPGAVILWCFLRFPELEPEDTDRVACTRVEELTVNASVVLLLLVLVAGVGAPGPLEPVYPPASYALLVAMAASVLTGTQRAEARGIRTPEEARFHWIHRGLTLLKTGLLVTACALAFSPARSVLSPFLEGALPPWSVLPSQVLLLALVAAMGAGFLNALGDRLEASLWKSRSAS